MHCDICMHIMLINMYICMYLCISIYNIYHVSINTYAVYIYTKYTGTFTRYIFYIYYLCNLTNKVGCRKTSRKEVGFVTLINSNINRMVVSAGITDVWMLLCWSQSCFIFIITHR